MPEIKTVKIRLVTLLLTLFIIIFIAASYCIYKINKNNTIKANNSINTDTNIQATDYDSEFIDNNHLILNEENYNKFYNSDKHLINIQKAVNNGDGTVTLTENIYEKYILGDESEFDSEEKVAHFINSELVLYITLNENFKCTYESESNSEEKTLKEIAEKYKNINTDETLEDEENDTRSIISDKFIFNNGKCEKIIFHVAR